MAAALRNADRFWSGGQGGLRTDSGKISPLQGSGGVNGDFPRGDAPGSRISDRWSAVTRASNCGTAAHTRLTFGSDCSLLI